MKGNLDNNFFVLAVSIDQSKAFDLILDHLLITKLSPHVLRSQGTLKNKKVKITFRYAILLLG